MKEIKYIVCENLIDDYHHACFCKGCCKYEFDLKEKIKKENDTNNKCIK